MELGGGGAYFRRGVLLGHYGMLASFPGHRPAFCRLQYGASDEKLGNGLETRLTVCMVCTQQLEKQQRKLVLTV